jgi:Zn-dependent protease
MRTCAVCGTTAPESFLDCPKCLRLFFASELRAKSAEADALEAAGDLTSAASKLREMIALLPANSGQVTKIRARLASLETRAPGVASRKRVPAWLTGFGAVGIFLWKLGAPLLGLLSKAQFLFVGLLQAKTLFTMLFATSLYERAGFGSSLALFMGSIYVHEMGHVWAFRRYGIAVSAPMFVPGIGAFVRGAHYPEAPNARADVALSGPIWGCSVAFGAWLVALWIGSSELALGAILVVEVNLFNLIPVWQLDGSRAIAVLDRRQRVVLGILGMLSCGIAGSPMGAVAGLGHLVRAFVGARPESGEGRALRAFVVLMFALALVRGLAAGLVTE